MAGGAGNGNQCPIFVLAAFMTRALTAPAMKMTANILLLAPLALAAAQPGHAQASHVQPVPPQSPSASAFSRLFTPWTAAAHDSLTAESGTRAPSPAADEGDRARIQAAALGERVGEIVRAGDCEEGERVARAAGDFALVQAVRDHCRRRN
jgi:hypothetical protein